MITFPTCESCTLQRLQQTHDVGGFVMSKYATVTDLERDRYAFHYLSHVKNMKYQIQETPPHSHS